MKKLGMFRFLFAFMMLNHFIIDGEGAGSGGDDAGGDIGDIDIDDENNGADDEADKTSKEKDNNINEDSKNDMATLKKELDELKADKEKRESDTAVNIAIKELGDKHNGFDSNKVKEYLTGLNKTNPDKANMLNNPVGWENVWLNEFASKEVDNDNPAFGRNIAPSDRSEEVLEKVKDGEWLSVEDELQVYGKHL